MLQSLENDGLGYWIGSIMEHIASTMNPVVIVTIKIENQRNRKSISHFEFIQRTTRILIETLQCYRSKREPVVAYSYEVLNFRNKPRCISILRSPRKLGFEELDHFVFPPVRPLQNCAGGGASEQPFAPSLVQSKASQPVGRSVIWSSQ